MARAWGIPDPRQLLDLDGETYGLMLEQLAREAEARAKATD